MADGPVIGVDLGTTSVKVTLLDPAHGVIATTSTPSVLVSHQPAWAEADALTWRTGAEAAIHQVLTQSGVAGVDIQAIATTGMVPAVVCADSTGAPLRNAILQNDGRAGREVAELRRELEGVAVVELTGSAITQQSVAPTLRWLQRWEPDVWARCARIVGSYDWLLSAWGAEPHVEENWAIESGLYRLDLSVVDAVASGSGVGDRLTRVLRPGEIAGELSRAAAFCGLRPGTPLVVGGADHVLSAWASGVVGEGDWLVKLGGGGDILVVSPDAVVDERLYLDAHPVRGSWLPNGCMATSGSLVRWVQEMVGGPSLSVLDAEAARRPAGDLLCLPYFLGEKSPLHDVDLRGAFVGLHLGHTRADLHRAALESTALAMRAHLDIFDALGLRRSSTGLVSDGGSTSQLWLQILADVLGSPMRPVQGHPGGSLGAAVSAALATGGMKDPGDAGRFARLGPVVDPDPATGAVYDDTYARWAALGASLTPLSHQLSARQGEQQAAACSRPES